MSDAVLPPGGPEAVAAGCRCSVTINRHGRGDPMVSNQDGTVGYWPSYDCPLHGVSENDCD